MDHIRIKFNIRFRREPCRLRVQVAEQQGKYLARELNEQARAHSPGVPSVAFKYRHLGSMASLGELLG